MPTTALKLVHSHPIHVAAPRPFTTYYYHSVRDGDEAYAKIGRAASERGAMRAAVVRVFLGEYEKVIIYEDDVPVLNITGDKHGITIGYGRALNLKRARGV